MRNVEAKDGDHDVSSWQEALRYMTYAIIHPLQSWEIFTWVMLHVYVCMAYNTRQIISEQYHIWNTNISVRVLRSSGMLRSYVGSSLPMFRDSLPVQYSRGWHSSWTELPDWVSPKRRKTTENVCCVTSTTAKAATSPQRKRRILINCVGVLNMYTFKTCIDVQYPLWEWSDYCMDSQGIAGRGLQGQEINTPS